MNDKEIDKELEKHFGKPPLSKKPSLSTEEIVERLKSCSQEEAFEMVFGDLIEENKKDKFEIGKNILNLEIQDHEYNLVKLDAMQLSTKYKADLAIALFCKVKEEIDGGK
jgi:hypothetical protein|tara:strand:- start:3102 stop:3431 length:330 start_codon:yes stop_codon:yes gene_type:complete